MTHKFIFPLVQGVSLPARTQAKVSSVILLRRGDPERASSRHYSKDAGYYQLQFRQECAPQRMHICPFGPISINLLTGSSHNRPGFHLDCTGFDSYMRLYLPEPAFFTIIVKCQSKISYSHLQQVRVLPSTLHSFLAGYAYSPLS